MIDSHSIVDPTARISDNVTIGPWTQIGPYVEIGSGTTIGSHVIIEQRTKIGRENKIHSFTVLGGDPQDIHYKGEPTWLEIGDNNIIREFCSVSRGSNKTGGCTRIGNNNFLMAYVHIAHDCFVGNEVIFANNASIAGHVVIEDFVVLGPFAGVHQFCRVGAYSFLGRAAKIYQDILPYMLVTGNPGVLSGLNMVGLKRRGFGKDTLRALKRAYRLFYHRGLKLTEICDELEELSGEAPEISRILEIVKQSRRGIVRPQLLSGAPVI